MNAGCYWLTRTDRCFYNEAGCPMINRAGAVILIGTCTCLYGGTIVVSMWI